MTCRVTVEFTSLPEEKRQGWISAMKLVATIFRELVKERAERSSLAGEAATLSEGQASKE